MALWGISTNTETAANNYALPKYIGRYNATSTLVEAEDRVNSPYNCFADNRGWVYRHYGTTDQSGISTSYYDEVLIPISGLNTAGTGSNSIGLGNATPFAVFFEDPNLASPISVSAGATTGIGTGRTGYVHVVYNELVYVSAGASVLISQHTASGVTTGSAIVAVAASTGVPVSVNVPGSGDVYVTYNGQLTNRVSFAFTAPSSGIGTVLTISLAAGLVGVVTDASGGGAAVKVLTGLLKNVAGAGSSAGVGIGVTTLTIRA